MKHFRLATMRIPLIYAIFGLLWILFTDRLLLLLEPDIVILVQWQTYKGWLFVILSTAIIYWLVARSARQNKAAQAALAHNERLYRLLFNNNPLPMWAYDATNLSFLEVNNAAVNKYQYSRAEFLALTIKDIRPPEDIPLLLEDVAQTTQSLNFAGEWRHHRKDGTEFPVEIISHELVFNGRPARLVVAKDLTEQKRAEAERASVFQRNQALVQALGEIVYEWFPQQDRVTWEGDHQRILGYSATEMGINVTSWREKIHPEDRARVDLETANAIEQKQNLDVEYRFLQQDGTYRWMHDRGVVNLNEQGELEKIVGVFLDINGRKQTEKALRQNELRFRHLAENAQDIIYSYAFEPEPNFTFVSPSVTKITGYTPTNHYENPYLGRELVHPDDQHILGEIIQGQRDLKKPVTLRWIRKDGTVIWTEQRNVPIYNEEGKVIGIEGIARDISENVRAQQALRDSEKRFRKAIEYAPFPIIIHAEDGEMLAISQTCLDITGYTFAEISTVDRWAERAYGTDQAQVMAGIDKLYESNTRIDEGEFTITCKDGSQRIWQFSSTPLGRLPDDRRSVISIAVDVTDRKNTEKQMHLQNSALNAAANGIVITDINGNVEWANPAFTELTGYTLAEAVGKNPRELVNSGTHDRAMFESLWQTILSGNVWRGELINRRKDGTHYHEEEAITPVWNEDGVMTHFIAIKQDITKRKQTEEEREQLLKQVQSQAKQMNQIMQSVPEGIFLLDPTGTILIANDKAQEYLALLANVAVGDTLTALGDISVASLLTQSGPGNWHEIRFQNHIFELIPQQVKSGPISEGWVLVLREVTAQKQIEEQLHRQERLAAIGQLAAGIAHDFNNLMAVILLYAEMLTHSPRLLDKEKAQLHTVTQQAKRAARLIEQILDFSRRAVFERRPLNLLSLLKEEVKLLKRTLPENIEIKLESTDGNYIIRADVTRIQQTIMNLAFNARDAMPEGGRLQFELSQVSFDQADQTPLPLMPPGSWVQLVVRDTGTGIDPVVMDHLFEPFVTTKGPGKGTGLGLSQVHGIVAQHEGFITVQSEPGIGATFELFFPAMTLAEDAFIPDAPETAVSGQGQRLLVVEDEPDLRDALVESLSLLQYDVVETANGAEALALLEQGTAVDLIICDVIMPQMGGIPFVQALQKQTSPPPVIFVTGHPLDVDSDKLQEMGVCNVLPKPTQPALLSQAIATALNDK